MEDIRRRLGSFDESHLVGLSFMDDFGTYTVLDLRSIQEDSDDGEMAVVYSDQTRKLKSVKSCSNDIAYEFRASR